MIANEQNLTVAPMLDAPAITRDEAIVKLRELIKGIKIAMLTTFDRTDNTLRSRPMGTQEVEFSGELWFFTDVLSEKAHEIEANTQVNLSYVDTHGHRYVSVSGTASLVYDRARMEEFWQPMFKAWFPDGLDSPNLALMRVMPEKAEYWESDARIKTIITMAKSLVTHQEADDVGRNAQLEFKAHS